MVARTAHSTQAWGVVLAASLAALSCGEGAKAPAQSPATKGAASDPLSRANEDFHTEYAAARARELAALGTSRPYLALGDGKLVLRYGGKTEERTVSSPRFDAVKDASHLPIAAVSAILAKDDAKALRDLEERIREVEPAITADRLGDAEQAAHAIVRASAELLEAALAKTPSEDDLKAFGVRTRGDQTTLLQAGCDESLVRIDSALRQLRPRVGDAWSQAVVTIATDHQSRAEEVGVQYFEHLFHERASEGALGESRIVVIESIGHNDGPMQAMASHLVDQRLSALLFDDPTFLQGDVLGKHAEPTIARLLATPF
ncbi:MAG TPA: hypothetical protein VF765_18225 [Polyangiaceae bacterium]